MTGASALSSLPELQEADTSHVGRAPQISPHLASSVSFTHALLQHSLLGNSMPEPLRSTKLLTEHLLHAKHCPGHGVRQVQTTLINSTQCAVLSRSVQSHSFETPWTVACQAPLPMDFQARIPGGLPFPPSGDLPDPGVEPLSHWGSQIELRGLQNEAKIAVWAPRPAPDPTFSMLFTAHF